MIDTVRLRGPAEYYKFSTTYEKYMGFKRDDGTHYVPMVLVENKLNSEGESIYRAFIDPHRNIMDVEFNPHKLMFKDNVYNYEINPATLNQILRHFGNVFFRSSHYWVTRLDLGSVSTFPSFDVADATLEKYRRSRFPGARIRKFKHQNYASSVFYQTPGWSIKIYNKGIEMKDNAKTFPHFDLMATLRFEKTYRTREFERLGMPKEKYRGVHIDEFDISILTRDFFSQFANWDFVATPHVTGLKRQQGLLAVLDNAGLLSDVETQNIVSRSTIWRYRKAKKAAVDTKQKVDFRPNLPNNLLQKFRYYRTFGVASLF